MKALRRVLFAAVDVIGVQVLLTKLQDSLEEVLRDIQKADILDGQLITDISVDSANTLIPHSLGRRPKGWYIVRQRANATVWDNQDSTSSNPSPTRFLALEASTQVTVDIWVF